MNLDTHPALIGTAKHRLWVLFSICTGAFLTHFTAGIVNVSLPSLTSVFQTDLDILQWITTAYLLAIAALLPIMGKLGDRYGHGLIHNMGYLIFAVSSLLIALSPNVLVLVSFRILQGIGAAMFQATNIALIQLYYPKEQRGRALGIMSSVVALGAMTGPLAGGLIAERLSWHWLFLIHLPIAAGAVALAYRFIPIQRPSGDSPSIDRVSALLFVAIIASMIYGLSSGNAQGWFSAIILSVFVGGGFVLALFLRRESRLPVPFLPLQVLRIPSVLSGLVTSCASFVLINAILVVMPFYLSHMTSYPPAYIGLIMTAYPLLFAISSPVSGHLSDRINPRLLMFIGLGCIVTGLAVFSYFLAYLTVPGLVAVLAWMGLGMGCLAAPNNGYIMRSVPFRYAGSIGGMIALTRNAGMALGAAVGLGMVTGHAGTEFSIADFERIFRINVIIGLCSCAALGYGAYIERRSKPISKQSEETGC
ncbi:MFS transporter [Paenibacillus ihbetae]|uniref:MFS transporter n=1 Tax=Paenibacillus ihbetae TaxID=1870820 RepID=A0A1B2E4M7_9BACL|nr:MFS transporter [Paenibacillus ihbetae]ANY74920.1 MFS transporter [Paenibacillus ihbetae]OOC62917.1 MFS transporter [Paenibacillus ihbetae]